MLRHVRLGARACHVSVLLIAAGCIPSTIQGFIPFSNLLKEHGKRHKSQTQTIRGSFQGLTVGWVTQSMQYTCHHIQKSPVCGIYIVVIRLTVMQPLTNTNAVKKP